MARHPSKETLVKFAEMIYQGMTVKQVMAVASLKEDSVRRYLSWAMEKGYAHPGTHMKEGLFVNEDGTRSAVAVGNVDDINIEESAQTLIVEVKSTHIETVDEALERADVDLQVWEVEKYKKKADLTYGEGNGRSKDPGTFNAPLWHFQVWLKRRVYDIDASLEHIAEAFKNVAPTFVPAAHPWANSGVLLEIEFPDLHMGKHSWGRQTGADYDHKICMQGFETATDELLSLAATMKPERMLVPVGHDILHVDNINETTTRGTAQDVDTRPQLLFDKTVEMLVSFLRKARQIAPITVQIVPGNHDMLTCHHIGAALQGYFWNDKHIEIDNEPTSRKYYRWGTVLLGFVHGGKEDPRLEDLPLLMAVERPEDWAETTHREWHTGHIHRRRAMQWLTTDSTQGIHVRTLPSLCAADAWHAQHGYVGQPRVAEMYVFSSEHGYVGHFSTKPVREASST